MPADRASRQRWQFIQDRRLLAGLVLALPVWLLLAVAGLSPAPLAGTALLMVILVRPVIEELVFRGLLQGWLRQKTHGQWQGITLANLLASIAFSLAHLLYQPPVWAAAIFIPSLVFGYFRDRHESVVSPIILHAWYNAGFFLLPFLGFSAVS